MPEEIASQECVARAPAVFVASVSCRSAGGRELRGAALDAR
ncbi:hypothetical protein [Thauera sp.]|nr:hypothetical protein [Thauera sp.]